MKALIIVNPMASSKRSAAKAAELRTLVTERLRATGKISDLDWKETQHPRHAVELAQTAAQQGYGYIFAAGGDGTISEVVNGIMQARRGPQERPALGVLPWGTLNDFYAALKLAEKDRQAQSSDEFTQPLDIGRAVFDGVERYTCLSISIGFSSWANEQYQQASKRFGRRFAHIPAAINTLMTYKAPRMVQVSLDNTTPQTKPMLSMAVSNGPTVGGGSRLTPDAKIDDGQFDLCIIAPIPLWLLGFFLLQSYAGLRINSRSVELGRAKSITITSQQPFSVHLDGELIPEVQSKVRSLRVEVLPAELQVVKPSILED